MLIFKEVNALRTYLEASEESGKTIGFVPTMGALHEGHMALIRASNASNDITLSTIFVNPAQFNEQSDFDSYPVQIEQDAAKLELENCTVLYLPKVEEVYPSGDYEKPVFDFKGLDSQMEGAFRPGHFFGVGEVIKRFIDLMPFHRMYLGAKDYQQVQIVKRVVEQFDYDVEVVSVPTEREAGGLAMSSRNLLLSEEAKDAANVIYQTLNWVRDHYSFDQLDQLLDAAKAKINSSEHLEVEYLIAADASTLQILESAEPTPVVLCISVWANGVRLIDNIVIEREYSIG